MENTAKTAMKQCARCRQERPKDAFGLNRSREDGRQPWCRSCRADHNAGQNHPVTITGRRCARCHHRRPANAFNRSRRTQGGLWYYCKSCKRELGAEKRERSVRRALDLSPFDIRPEELGYVAGLLDGEGSIQMNARQGGGYPSVLVSIYNTDFRVMEWLLQKLGGKIYVHRHGTRKAKTSYRWSLPKWPGLRFLNNVYPWLVIKRERAYCALEFTRREREFVFEHCTHALPTPLPDEFQAFVDRMTALNRRGPLETD